MKALSDPSRIKIIKMLERKKDMCVCEIRAMLGLAQPTVSKHLKILEDAGLVESFKDKLWVNYRLAKSSDNPYALSQLKSLRGWLNDAPEIKMLQQQLPTINRQQLCKTSE